MARIKNRKHSYMFRLLSVTIFREHQYLKVIQRYKFFPRDERVKYTSTVAAYYYNFCVQGDMKVIF